MELKPIIDARDHFEEALEHLIQASISLQQVEGMETSIKEVKENIGDLSMTRAILDNFIASNAEADTPKP